MSEQMWAAVIRKASAVFDIVVYTLKVEHSFQSCVPSIALITIFTICHTTEVSLTESVVPKVI